MDETKLHPLDFKALKKGQFLNQSDVEEATGVRFATDPRRYQLSLMQLREAIWDRCEELIAKISGLGIRILTDREGETYLWNEVGRMVRKLRRIARARARIDRSNFTEAEQRESERRDLFTSALALENAKSLRKFERELKLQESNG